MSQKAKQFKEAIVQGKEARLCREAFIRPNQGNRTYSIYERLQWKNIIFVGIVLYLLMSVVTGFYTIIGLKTQENNLMHTRIDTVQHYKDLKEKVAWMKTDEAVENIARDQLGMVEAGEILVARKNNQE